MNNGGFHENWIGSGPPPKFQWSGRSGTGVLSLSLCETAIREAGGGGPVRVDEIEKGGVKEDTAQ